MPAGARRCRLGALLQVAVALSIIATRTQGQLVDIRPCLNYQSAKNFNRDYVAKLLTVADGYSLLLTSEQTGPSSCERLAFRLNGTFMFSYSDSDGVPHNHTGRFAVKEASFTHPGYIDLDLPPGVLGAPLFRNLRLFVIVAEEHYLVVTSCQAIGLISIERVHVFFSTSQLNATSATSLNTSLAEMKVPHIDLLREVNQNCSTGVGPAAGTNSSAFSQFSSSRAPLTQFLRLVFNPSQWLFPLPSGRHVANSIGLPSLHDRVVANGPVLPLVEGRHNANGIGLPSLHDLIVANGPVLPLVEGRHVANGIGLPSLHDRIVANGPVLPLVEGRHAVNGIDLPLDTRQWVLSTAFQPFTYSAWGSYMEQPQNYPLTAAEYLAPDFYDYDFISSASNYRETLLNYFPSEPKYLSSVVNYHPSLFNIPASPVNP